MANHALATLETALRARKLDRTLTTALPSLDRIDPGAMVPTDVDALDAALRGGLPRGQLSEINGPRSSGRMTLLLQLLAAATRQDEVVAFVDTFDRLDVASAAAAGIDLRRLLWVRGQAISRTEGATDLRERTIDRALKALNLVLQAGGFALVAIDLADVPAEALRRLPYTTWLRVQRVIEGSDTACVLTTPEPLARSAGGVTLSLAGRTRWTGAAARSRRVDGLDVTVRIVSPRRRAEGEVQIAATAAEQFAGIATAQLAAMFAETGTPRHRDTEITFTNPVSEQHNEIPTRPAKTTAVATISSECVDVVALPIESCKNQEESRCLGVSVCPSR